MSSPERLQNGRYAVSKKLGDGGKGNLYKARDTVSDAREGSIFGAAELKRILP